jgi:hypothetical protein
MSGSAVLTTKGQLRLGVTIMCATQPIGTNLMATLVGTPDFAMLGRYDGDLDSVPDAKVGFSLEPENCATAPVP